MVALAFPSKSVIELLIVREAVHTLAKPPANLGQKHLDDAVAAAKKIFVVLEAGLYFIDSRSRSSLCRKSKRHLSIASRFWRCRSDRFD